MAIGKIVHLQNMSFVNILKFYFFLQICLYAHYFKKAEEMSIYNLTKENFDSRRIRFNDLYIKVANYNNLMFAIWALIVLLLIQQS